MANEIKIIVGAQLDGNTQSKIEEELQSAINKIESSTDNKIKLQFDTTGTDNIDSVVEKIKSQIEAAGGTVQKISTTMSDEIQKVSAQFQTSSGEIINATGKVSNGISTSSTKIDNDFKRIEAKTQQFKTRLGEIKNIDLSNFDNMKSFTNFAKATQGLDTEVTKFGKTINVAGENWTQYSAKTQIAKGQTETFTYSINKETGEVAVLDSGIQKATEAHDSLIDRFKTAISSTITWTVAVGGLYGAINSLKSAVNTVVSLDTSMTNIEMITGYSRSQVESLMNTYQDLSSTLHSTTLETATAAEEFLRAGNNGEQSAQLVKSATEMSKISGQTMSDSGEELIQIMNSFKLSASDMESVVDKMTTIDNNYATSTGEIATAMGKSSQSAQAAGVSINQLISYIGTISSTTRQSAEIVGTALNSIFSRYQNIAANKTVDNMGESINNVDKVLSTVGINIKTQSGGFVQFGTVLDQLSAKWSNLTDQQKAQVATALAGTRQHDEFLALMNNMTIATKMQTQELNSSGNAWNMYGNHIKSVKAKEEDLAQAFQIVARNIVSSDVIGNAAENISKVVSALGNVPTILSAIGTAIALIEGKNITSFFKNLGEPTSAINALKQSLQNYIDLSDSASNSSVKLNKNTQAIVDSINKNTQAVNGLNIANKAEAESEELNANITKANTEAETLNSTSKKENVIATNLCKESIAEDIASKEADMVATGAATAETNLFSLSIKALGIAIASNPIGTIALAITTLITIMDGINEAQQEAVEKAIEASNTYKTESSSLNDLISQYEELGSKTDKTTEDKTALKSIQDQLVSSYGAEKDNIDLVNGSYKDQIGILQQLSKQKAEDYMLANQDQYNKAKNILSQSGSSLNNIIDANFINELKYVKSPLLNGVFNEVSGDNGINGSLQQRVNILKQILKNASNISNQTDTEKAFVASVNTEYNTLNEQLTNSKSIIEQMDNAKLNFEFSTQIGQIKNDITQAQNAAKTGNTDTSNKLMSDADKVKSSIDNALTKEGRTDLIPILDTLINGFTGTADAVNKDKDANNKDIDSVSTLSDYMDKLADSTSDEAKAMKNAESALTNINGALQKTKDGIALTADEVLKLVTNYNLDYSAVTKTADGYKISQSALEKLQSAQISEAETSIQSSISNNETIIKTCMSNVEAYGIEANALLNLQDVESKINEIQSEKNSATSNGAPNGASDSYQRELDQLSKLKEAYSQNNAFEKEKKSLEDLLKNIGTESAKSKDITKEKKAQQTITDNINNKEKELESTYKKQTSELDKQKQALQDQLDTLKKKYDLEKSEETEREYREKVKEAQQNLQAVQENKNTMILENGKWTAEADPEALKNAQNTLKEAQKTLNDFLREEKYNNQKNAIQAQIDAIDAKKTAIENNYNSQKEALESQKSRNKGYASGTDNAEAGEHHVAEDKAEIVIGNQVKTFDGGEIVINGNDTEKILSGNSQSKLLNQMRNNLNNLAQDCITFGYLHDKNIGKGITDNQDNTVLNSQNKLISQMVNNITSFVTDGIQYGQYIDTKLGQGINDSTKVPINSTTDLTDSIGNNFSNFVKSCIDYGKGINTELDKGIKDSSIQKTITDDVKSLTDLIINQFKTGFGIHSPSRVMYSIGNFLMQGLINGMTSNDIQSFISSQVGNAVNGAASAGMSAVNGNISTWLATALALTGTDMSWLPALEMIISRESGTPGVLGTGNASSVNSIPVGNEFATGLMQMLPSTFNEFALSNLKDIFNPIDNIVASIRYIKERYGTPYNIPNWDNNNYKGYAEGTDNAEAGIHKVGENAPNDPELIIVNKPTTYDFKGEEKVIPFSKLNLSSLPIALGMNSWNNYNKVLPNDYSNLIQSNVTKSSSIINKFEISKIEVNTNDADGLIDSIEHYVNTKCLHNN